MLLSKICALLLLCLIARTASHQSSTPIADNHPSKQSKTNFNKNSQLPWQIKYLHRFLPKLQAQPEDPSPSSLPLPSTTPKSTLRAIHHYLLSSKGQLIIYGKISVIVILGFLALRQIGNWYKGVAQFELLLDKNDYEHHIFGNKLSDIGNDLFQPWQTLYNDRSIDYNQLYILQYLQTALRTHCFPLKYSEYVQNIGKDMSKIISEIEKINRNSRRRKRPATTSPEETQLMNQFHTSLLILESRQLETSLRVLLSTLLNVANQCEDLVDVWKLKLQKNSQIRRLPYSKERLANSIRKVTFFCSRVVLSTGHRLRVVLRHCTARILFWKQHVQSPIVTSPLLLNVTMGETEGHRDLSTKEKLLLLQTLSQSVYTAIGGVKEHLHQLDSLRMRVVKTGIDASEETAIREWISQGTNVSRLALAALHTSPSEDPVMAPVESTLVETEVKAVELPPSALTLEEYITSQQYRCSTRRLYHLLQSVSSLLAAQFINATVPLSPEGPAIFRRCVPIGEFILPIGLHDTVAVCLIHDDVFIRTLHAIGDEVISGGAWSALPLSSILPLDNISSSLPLEQPSTALWTKQISYRHSHKGLFFGRLQTDYSLIQALNISSIDLDHDGREGDGTVTLATYVNASQKLFQHGYNYTVLSTFVSLPLEHSHEFLMSARRTKVLVSVEVEVARNTSSVFSAVENDVSKYMKEFMLHWKTAALAAIAEDGILDKKKNLTESESVLLRILGHEEEALTTLPVETALASPVETVRTRKYSFHRSRKLPSATTIEQNSVAAAMEAKSNKLLNDNLLYLKAQLRTNMAMHKDIGRAHSQLIEYLETMGLSKRKKYTILQVFRLRRLLRLLLWGGVWQASMEVSRRWEEIAELLASFRANAMGFFERRISTPSKSIFYDVLLNKKMSLTDKDALVDAKRSLSTMLYDFLAQHGPKMSDAERRRISTQMDMSPISQEYEVELRRPIQNILSGRLARLILIQLQFVKKELLMAMQGLDQLFSSNQVNLQLMAVTPAIMILLVSQSLAKMLFGAIVSTSRGRFVESSVVVYRDLRARVRDLERMLTLSLSYTTDPILLSPGNNLAVLTGLDQGRILSALFRIQKILLFNSIHFDRHQFKQLQEDLRDLADFSLCTPQRLVILDRMSRSYSFLIARQKSWGSALIS